jgi:hypothetical protein
LAFKRTRQSIKSSTYSVAQIRSTQTPRWEEGLCARGPRNLQTTEICCGSFGPDSVLLTEGDNLDPLTRPGSNSANNQRGRPVIESGGGGTGYIRHWLSYYLTSCNNTPITFFISFYVIHAHNYLNMTDYSVRNPSVKEDYIPTTVATEHPELLAIDTYFKHEPFDCLCVGLSRWFSVSFSQLQQVGRLVMLSGLNIH